MNNKGQVTIFVILGIIIFVSGLLFFLLKDSPNKEIPESFEPIETSFLSCIENKLQVGIKIMQSKGGYIYNPNFVSGSIYQPFSSELNFVGIQVPYWYYIAGSNLEKYQVPTVSQMESQLEIYLKESLENCRFDEFTNQGYIIDLEEPEIDVSIKESYVDVSVDSSLTITKDLQIYVFDEHVLRFNSELGNLYEAAKEVYYLENENYFLENYSIDVMRMYLPVDGFKISCSPLSWDANELVSLYKEMLEANTLFLNNRNEKNDYYNIDFSTDYNLKVIYSSNWPTYFEINPAERNKLIAKPIGNNAELGILGFCYVPYHFVYNIRHPVLIQVSKGNEIFQFPTLVIIDGNVAKESLATEPIDYVEQSNICEEMNLGYTEINVYDENLNVISDAQISFDCFDSSCNLGSTKDGIYTGSIPQCVNGILRISAEGYKTGEAIYTTVKNTSIAFVLDKEYQKEISLIVDGKEYFGNAILSFASEYDLQQIYYPQDKFVNLSKGIYEIGVQLISNTSIEFPETTKEQCYDVSRPGLLGLAGFTKKECMNVTIPLQIISNSISGGDKINVSFVLDDLKYNEEIVLSNLHERIPTTLEEIQVNYALMESGLMEVELK